MLVVIKTLSNETFNIEIDPKLTVRWGSLPLRSAAPSRVAAADAAAVAAVSLARQVVSARRWRT